MIQNKANRWARVVGTWRAADSFVRSVASRATDGTVSLEVLAQRRRSCFGGDGQSPCPSLGGSDDFHYCNDCGCGARQMARLDGDGYTKLHYPFLRCPRGMPGFSNHQEPKPEVAIVATPAPRINIPEIPAAFENPTVSVVMAALNEGPDLETTVACLCSGSRVPEEIIVVDNGSREPIGDRLDVFRRYTDLRVIRYGHNTGSGRGKSHGLDAATGDLLIVMDSHVRPRWDFIEIARDAFVKWPSSAFCPWSYGFAHHPPTGRGLASHNATFAGRGAEFFPEEGFWNIRWRKIDHQNEPEHGAIIPCLLGGVYAFGRTMLGHIGGYNRTHLWYGAEQDFASLRVWIAGSECRLLNTPVPHKYTDKNKPTDRTDATGVKPPAWAIWFNRHVMMATIFEDESYYRDVYGPLMRKVYWPDELRDKIAEVGPEIASIRAKIASIRRRSDSELAAALGTRLPRTINEYLEWERECGRKP